MQPVTGPPRDALTAADIAALVQGDDEVRVTAGLELLDASDGFIADISDDLETGVVECGNYRTIHRTCRLTISRKLVWGSQRVKPYLVLSTPTPATDTLTGVTWGSASATWGSASATWAATAAGASLVARFNLGVYLLSTPVENLGDPDTFDVEGYDKLEVLAHPHGASHHVAAGTAYLTAAAALISAADANAVVVTDPAQAATVLPSDRVWPLDETTTTLEIVNDLLAAVNYRAVWVDWDGRYRLTPYVSPAERAAEWVYDADNPTTTIVGETRSRERDFFATPNRWVGVRNNPTEGIPVDGAGRYETINQSTGDTSIDARGRTITRTLFLDAASQASLVAQVDAAKEEDMQVAAYRRFTTGPNPLHWHFDVARLVDADAGPAANVAWLSWTLPLDGADMTHETREV